ncbi:hypothetical protein ED5_2845 [Enterobacter roggenkampii]|nr:hypothetical protein ED5_2845 [Enterobacter roggenkampii]
MIAIKKIELQRYFYAFINNHSGVCGYSLFYWFILSFLQHFYFM